MRQIRSGNRYRWICALAALVMVPICSAQSKPGKSTRFSARVLFPPGTPGTDGPEWTAFTPSADTVIVYVSTSTGDDAFSGLDIRHPKRSLAAAYPLLRSGFPDWMLLRRGDVWSESFPQWQKGGRSTAEPMVIGSYATGDRPQLNTGSGNGFFSTAYPTPLAHLALTDIHFFADRSDGTGDGAGVTFLENWDDLLIENCKVEGYPVNLVIQEAVIGRASNIRLRRNVIVDAYRTTGAHSQGMFAGAIDNLLIEECVFDYNGWRRGVPGAQANIFNHNMYLHESSTGVVTRGNITARAAATGILQRSGGISENNLSLLNPVGIFGGYTERPGVQARGAIRNNVILDARDIESDAPRGFGIWLGASRDTDVYGNIISHQRAGTGNVNGIAIEGEVVSVAVYQNVVYDWTIGPDANGASLSLNLTNARGITITDNKFQQPRGGFLVEYAGQPAGDTGPVFGRNVYYTQNAPPHQFFYGTDYSTWLLNSDEPWSRYAPITFPAPERTIETYMASLGLPPTLEAFLARARLQDRANWDPRFTAAAVNAYIQQGFGAGPVSCRADFNGDGTVNILDAGAFAAAIASGNPQADLNLDGVMDVTDQVLFQQVVNSGCP